MLISLSLLGATSVMAADSVSFVKPGQNAAATSNPNDSGHWRTNPETGEKTWVSGSEDQQVVDQALCSTPLLRMINHCE